MAGIQENQHNWSKLVIKEPIQQNWNFEFSWVFSVWLKLTFHE